MRTVDVDEVIALLERAVAERGEDFTYCYVAWACKYSHGDEPGCIVGHVLYYLGIPLEDMSSIEHQTVTSELVAPLLRSHDIVLTDTAAWVLRCAQSVQDGLSTWGEALDAARQAAGTVTA